MVPLRCSDNSVAIRAWCFEHKRDPTASKIHRVREKERTRRREYVLCSAGFFSLLFSFSFLFPFTLTERARKSWRFLWADRGMPGFTDNEHLRHLSSLHVLRLVDPFLSSCVPFSLSVFISYLSICSFRWIFPPHFFYFVRLFIEFSLSLSLIVFSLLRSGIATRCTDPKRGTHVPWSSFVRLWETMVTDRLPMLSRPWTRSFDSIFDDQVTSCAVKPANLPSSPSATLKFLVLASWLVVSILSNQTCFHSVRDGWQVSTVLSLDIYIYDDTFFFTSSFLFLRSPRFSPIRDAWSRNRFVRWSCWPRTLCAINELARIRGS